MVSRQIGNLTHPLALVQIVDSQQAVQKEDSGHAEAVRPVITTMRIPMECPSWTTRTLKMLTRIETVIMVNRMIMSCLQVR